MEGSYGVEESRRLLASKDLLDGTNSLSRNMWTNVSTMQAKIHGGSLLFVGQEKHIEGRSAVLGSGGYVSLSFEHTVL